MTTPENPELDAKVGALARKFIFFNLHLNQDRMLGPVLKHHLDQIGPLIAEIESDVARLGGYDNVRIQAEAALSEGQEQRIADALYEKAPDTIPEEYL